MPSSYIKDTFLNNGMNTQTILLLLLVGLVSGALAADRGFGGALLYACHLYLIFRLPSSRHRAHHLAYCCACRRAGRLDYYKKGQN